MPPPQTRTRSTPAPAAWRNRVRYRSGVTREGKTSSGIQFTPRVKRRTPLTTKVNPLPCASAERSTRTVRKPIRRRQESSGRPSSSSSTRSSPYSGCSPCPRGHHRETSGTSRVTTARSPSTAARACRPPTEARTARPRSAPEAVRSRSTWISTRPVPSVTVTSGRTSDRRAVDHRSSRTGRHRPAVTRVGPQSQPKLHAILRMYWKGSG